MKSFREYISYLIEDQEEHWVTMHGRHVLIGKGGKIIGGLGSSSNQKLKDVNFKTSVSVKPVGKVGKLISKSHTMNHVSTIKLSDLPQLQKTIQKMNKKAAQHNLPPIKFEVVPDSNREIKLPSHDDLSFDRFETVVDVKVDGETPVIKGHKLVATLERMGNENIIRSVSDKHDLSEYREKPLFCEHCGTARVKKNSIILENPDGKLIQVGKSCIKDFLQTDALDMYLKNLENLNHQIGQFSGQPDEDQEMERSKSGGKDYNISVHQVVAAALNLINRHGYVSRSAEGEGRASTAGLILRSLFSPHKDNRITPSEKEEEEAEKIVEWAKTQKGSDYLNNLRIIANNGFGNYRHIGYIASMPTAYRKAMEAEKPQEPGKEKKVSQHVGQVGEKIQSDVTVVGNREYESDYGISHVVRMEDKDGNVFVTFTTGPLAGAEVGETHHIVGTVKNHSDYKGNKQTQLTRCSIK